MNTKSDPKNVEFIGIGAGLPRTGTVSLTTALETVLPGRCHHMTKAIHHEEEWRDILTGKMPDEGFRNFFLSNNYVASVDTPSCFMYERLMRIFPDAKVILTIREPDRWVASMQSTIMRVWALDNPSFLFILLGIFPGYLGISNDGSDNGFKKWPKVFGKALHQHAQSTHLFKSIKEDNGVDFYNKWVASVESNVPKERLLKFHVKEGWGPLCKFLNVPEPDIPFPNMNTSEEYKQNIYRRNRRAWLLLYEMISIPLLAGGLYMLLRK